MIFIQPSWRRCEGAASVWLISGCLCGARRLHGEDRQKLNTSGPSGQMPEWSKEGDTAEPKTHERRFALLLGPGQDFEASAKFLGARPGFVFKRGRRGCAVPCPAGPGPGPGPGPWALWGSFGGSATTVTSDLSTTLRPEPESFQSLLRLHVSKSCEERAQASGATALCC